MAGGGVDLLAVAAIVFAVALLLAAALLVALRRGTLHPRLPRGGDRVLASDRARDEAVAVLAGAYATGRLTREELEDRTRLVLAARTRGEITLLTGDVAHEPRGA